MPQECFDALLEDTKREFQEIWKLLTAGAIEDPPALEKAYRLRPFKEGNEYKDPGVVQAHVEVLEADLPKYLSLSGKHGVSVQLAGYYTEHPLTSTIIPLPKELTFQAARDWVAAKCAGDYALGVIPMRKDWTRYALRVPAENDKLMYYQGKVLDGTDDTGREFMIKSRYIVDNVPKGTDVAKMLVQVEQVHGWKAMYLKDMRSEINPSTAMAIMVGALDEPTKTIIDISPTQALFISGLTPSSRHEPKPAQWSLRCNRWNRHSKMELPMEDIPVYQSKAVEALNRISQESNDKDTLGDYEMGEEEVDDSINLKATTLLNPLKEKPEDTGQTQTLAKPAASEGEEGQTIAKQEGVSIAAQPRPTPTPTASQLAEFQASMLASMVTLQTTMQANMIAMNTNLQQAFTTGQERMQTNLQGVDARIEATIQKVDEMQTSMHNSAQMVETSNESQNEELRRVMSRIEKLELIASKEQVAGVPSAARSRLQAKREGPDIPEAPEGAKFQKVAKDNIATESAGTTRPSG